jgi:S-adenosylmethionine-diacylglycerol 3-amino-3-carboxypropyl transferase
MFGQEAIQHAPKNSYPRYFQDLLEDGLKRADATKNYFLHHIFLGYYFDRRECLPPYLANPNFEFQSELINGYLSNIKEIESYDYIMLSNIFDWMDLESVKEHCRILSKMKKGAILVLRQLNSSLDLQSFLKETFFFHDSLAEDFLKKDRSLFYEKLIIAEKK